MEGVCALRSYPNFPTNHRSGGWDSDDSAGGGSGSDTSSSNQQPAEPAISNQ